MNNRNAFETEADEAVGVDNRGFVLCFPPAQKQVETRMYQNRLRSAGVKRTLQAWNSARCVPRTVAQRQTFSFGT